MSSFCRFGLRKWSKFYLENLLSFWAPISSKFMRKKKWGTPTPKSSIFAQNKSRGTPTFIYTFFYDKIKPAWAEPSLVFLNCHHSDYPTFKMIHFGSRKWPFWKWGTPTFETGQMRLLFDVKFWQECSLWMIKKIVIICSKFALERWPLNNDYREDGTHFFKTR